MIICHFHIKLMHILFTHILLDCQLLETFISRRESDSSVWRNHLSLDFIYILSLNFNILTLKSITVWRWFWWNINLFFEVFDVSRDSCIENQIILFVFGSHRPASYIAISVKLKLARVLIGFVRRNILMRNHLC